MAETASRLREIQEDLADAADDVRRKHLSEEIGRALAKLLPQQRAEFLQSLSEQFPVWGEPAPAAANGSMPPQNDAAPDDPETLVDRLGELAKKLDDEGQRRMLGERLSGLAASLGVAGGTEGASSQAIDRLRQALHLRDKPLDLDRAMELLASLVTVTERLDSFAWTTYREIAPRQAPASANDFRVTLAKFLLGDPNVDSERAAERVDRLQKLLGALLTALSRTPGFADAYHENFEPERIEHATRAGRTALAALKEGLNSACWAHYRTLHEKLDRPGEEMRQRVIECIQKIDQTARARR